MASADNDDWKPNNRPKSTIALNFSNDLDNTFGMSNTDSGLDGLVKAVEQKKQALDSQSAELEALNARLKETEERLQKKANGNNPQAAAGMKATTPKKTFSPNTTTQQQKPESSLSSSTMNYWRGGGAQGETEGTPQTPSEMTRNMPGGFDGQ